MEKRRNGIKSGRILLGILAVLFCLSALVILVLGNSPNGQRDLRESPQLTVLSEFEFRKREIDAYAGVEKQYTTRLPELTPFGGTLFIYLNDECAEVFLGGTQVAFCRELSGRHVGKTTGAYWISVPVEERDSGEQLRIVTQPLYRSSAARDPVVLLSDWETVQHELVRQSVVGLGLSILCILLGTLSMIASAVIRFDLRDKMAMFSLGAFTLSIGIWRFCQQPLMPFLFPGAARLLSFLSEMGFIQMPLFFARFLRWKYQGKLEKHYRIISIVLLAETLLLFLLQLLNVVDLQAISHFQFIPAAVVLLPLFVQSLLDLLRGEKKRSAVLCNCIYVAFTVAATMDVYRYFRSDSRFLSMLILVALLHVVVVSVVIVRNSLESRQRLYEAEARLEMERTRLMLSQIQPHFLFNSLGVIRELCHSDPRKAEDATVMFSQYLRQNMASLSINGLVLFTSELRHVRNYLELERLRFGDALRVEYDIRTEEFRLPTLTLQPIVENAVRHGIRKREDGGTVRIGTRELDDCFEIRVEDDGPGFDPQRVPEEGHVGLKNVRSRLEQLCGGRLDIESEIGKGTCVTVTIPKRSE